MNEAPPPQRKRGCWFYGCGALIVICLLGGLLTYLGVRYLVRSAERLVAEYTDTTPVQLERVEVSPAQRDELNLRLNTFRDALEKQASPQELVLSAQDINALIATNQELRDKVVVAIEGDRLKGQISIPLMDLGPLKLKGRYLNGSATIKASLQNGVLVVRLDEVEVKGKPLPATIMTQLRNVNFAEKASQDARNAEEIRKFRSIEVKDDKILLRSADK